MITLNRLSGPVHEIERALQAHRIGAEWMILGDQEQALAQDGGYVTHADLIALLAGHHPHHHGSLIQPPPTSPGLKLTFPATAELASQWRVGSESKRSNLADAWFSAVHQSLALALDRGLIGQRLALTGRATQITVAASAHSTPDALYIEAIILTIGQITVHGGRRSDRDFVRTVQNGVVRWGQLDFKGLHDRRHELEAWYASVLDSRFRVAAAA